MSETSRRPPPLRVGMMGGTFDPVHHGHLRSALEVREALGLATLHMVPAPQPPLRDTPRVSAAQRFALLQAGIGDACGLVADDRELRREGPSYSVDTLAELRQHYGDEVSLVMVIGQDAFLRLANWDRAEQVFGLAHVVVIARPGYPSPWPSELTELVGHREVSSVSELMKRTRGGVLQLELPSRMAISATYIRQRLKEGKSVRYLVPEAVEQAIFSGRLYQTGE